MRRFLLALTLTAVTFPSLTAASAATGDRASRTVTAPLTAGLVTRTAVFVEHTGTDAAGRAFVSSLRRSIEASSQFQLSDSEHEAGIVLVVVSVSPSTARVASAVSLAYVANNEWRSLLGTGARFVGRDQAEAMGRATLEELSAVLAAYAPVGR